MSDNTLGKAITDLLEEAIKHIQEGRSGNFIKETSTDPIVEVDCGVWSILICVRASCNHTIVEEVVKWCSSRGTVEDCSDNHDFTTDITFKPRFPA